MELPAAPRSSDEVDYFAEEATCEHCDGRGLTEVVPAYQRGVLSGRCAACGRQREFRFAVLAPLERAEPFHLGPLDEPSRLFSAEQFRDIADRELELVPRAPAELPTLAAYSSARVHVVKAVIALNELVKFRPTDTDLKDEAERAAALYAEYQRAESVVAARPGAHPRPIGLEGRFKQHRAWLKRGRVGDGRALFRDEHWSRLSMATNLLTAAQFEESTFAGIDLSFGVFHEATFQRSHFLDCDLRSTEFDRAVFEGCDLADSRLSLANLIDVVVTGGNWQRVLGGRSTWRGQFADLDLRDASLRDSVLDDAVFTSCDFRSVDLRRKEFDLAALGTARRTHFRDCDLRGAKVAGLRLDGAVFERCRLHGIEGLPVLESDVQIVDCDFSAEGDGGADPAASVRLSVAWRDAAANPVHGAMTLDQALNHPGELLAVWDISRREEQLVLYVIQDGKLERLVLEPMSSERRSELEKVFDARGIRTGASDLPGPFVWSSDHDFTVWSLTRPVAGVIARGHAEFIEVAGGERMRRTDAARVVSFLDDDSLGHRGVNLVAQDGTILTIAEEHAMAAQLDPTYGIDHVMVEGAWATFLGRDLAAWLGVPHTDELP
ncbi:MAG: pentapeptide repeat-containing protein [Polyangiaceae bacterium]